MVSSHNRFERYRRLGAHQLDALSLSLIWPRLFRLGTGLLPLIDNYRKRKAFLEEIKHAIESGKDLYCFFYGVTPELKQVPSKKNPEQTFGVFSANIENLDHFIVREAPGLDS